MYHTLYFYHIGASKIIYRHLFENIVKRLDLFDLSIKTTGVFRIINLEEEYQTRFKKNQQNYLKSGI